MPATDRQGASRVEAELRDRLTPLVSSLGFDLEDVRVTRVGRRNLVKIVVDNDHGLELDDVADVSRAVDAELDGNDPFSGPFVLEVSSPGVDRPLTEPRHWRRNIGRLVQVESGGRPLTARIAETDDAGVTFDAGASHPKVPFAELGPGHVQIEFNRPASAGHDSQGS